MWEDCPPYCREDKIFCPPNAKPFVFGNVSNPYQKPLPLYFELLHRFTNDSDVVAEFTAGSGTLAVACTVGAFDDRHGGLFVSLPTPLQTGSLRSMFLAAH